MIENIGSLVKGHVGIFSYDKNGGDRQCLVNQDNAIHSENMSRAIAYSLSSDLNYNLYEIHFGNGGVVVDTDGKLSYRKPNVSQSSDELYNPTYFKVISNISDQNTDSNLNKIETSSVVGELFSDLVITATLDYDEPNSYDTTFNLADVNDRDQPSLDQTSTIQSFTFNELGLKTKGTSGLGKGLLLTHTIFHPVQKSTNRLIQIVYTLRFTVSEN